MYRNQRYYEKLHEVSHNIFFIKFCSSHSPGNLENATTELQNTSLFLKKDEGSGEEVFPFSIAISPYREHCIFPKPQFTP